MSLAIRFWTLVVNVLCFPMHVLKAVGLYEGYKRIFPSCQQRLAVKYNQKMHESKAELFRSLPEFTKPGGKLTLLEFGCGSGTNFEFYPRGCRVICTDPNPHFEKYLEKSMKENDHLMYDRFVVGSGEDMASIGDESVDAVVCTLVLCTVRDIPQTLREAHRVLRPGGAFFFLEHVVADPSTWSYFFQHVFQPVWYYFGDGCEVTRETWKYLEAAGFSELKLRHIEAPLVFIVKPHIAPSKIFHKKMPSCLMKLGRLVCLALSSPFYLLRFIGLRALYKRVFPFLAYKITFSYNDKMNQLKRDLFRNLASFANTEGTLRLLEIGCGSGANFSFYPYGCTVVCTDPNPHVESYLRRSMDANQHLTYEEMLVLSGEDMRGVRDESVDVVVCTLVLCSVKNVERVLLEARRILRNGGALFFLEHVVADPSTWTYFYQYVFAPLWYLLGDGCMVTRATWKNLEAAGFAELHLQHIEAPEVSVMIRPHIMGYLIK